MKPVPDDFGLDPVQTFAHVGDPSPSPEHSVFWTNWFDQLREQSPVLAVRKRVDESDPSATHEFISTGGVRIGCRLITPSQGTKVRASLVTVHGYTAPSPLGDEDRKWSSVCAKGVAVLSIRLRGYAGSRNDTEGKPIDLNADDRGGGVGGWVMRGFDSPSAQDWVLVDALGDVCNAVRVMRNALLGRDARDLEPWLEENPAHPLVFLHGRSLGGGLAMIAAAQLSGRMLGRPIVDRLGLEVPSLGAWRWRLNHSNTGLNSRIRTIFAQHPDRHEELMNQLRLMDAVVHGRKVRVPTLAMLASRDEVAPAPSAAAVFNAADSDPGQKWRFCVPYGHHKGDTANTRRVAAFGKVLADFFDPNQCPIDSMGKWEPKMGLE